jgi:hypothetical protein
LVTNDNVIGHHESSLWLTTVDEASTPTLGMTSFSLSVDIPLKIEQDSVSGLYIEEPVMEGTYKVSLAIELSRHSLSTFEGYRDNWSTILPRIEAHSGYNKIAIMLENAKLESAGPDDSEVAKEPLNFIIGKADSDVFTVNLASYYNIHSSPILFLIRNSTATQYMDLN